MADASDYFLGCDVSPCAFEIYWRLRGMENTMLDMAEAPGLARQVLARCVDFSIALSEKAIQRFPLDWLWMGDDVASQQAMLISSRTWGALVKPELARVFAGRLGHTPGRFQPPAPAPVCTARIAALGSQYVPSKGTF